MKNKILKLSLFIIILLILLLFNNNVFAYISSFYITLEDGNTIIIPTMRDILEDDNYIVCKRGTSLFYVAKLNGVPYDGKIYRSDNGKNSLNSVNYYYYTAPGVKGTYDIHYNEKDNSIIVKTSNRLNVTSYDIWYAMSLVYSNNYDIYNEDGTLYFSSNKVYDFDITLSTYEETSEFITAYTNYFSIDDIKKYECYISTDGDNWEKLKNTSTNTQNGVTTVALFCYIYENGTYYFKFINTETEEEYYISLLVENIIVHKAIPMPDITYSIEDGYVRLETQYMSLEDFRRYVCYYLEVDSEDKDSYSGFPVTKRKNMGSGTYTNEKNEIYYYYFLNIPFSDKDSSMFIFSYYDEILDDYSYITTFTIDWDFINKHSSSDSEIEENKTIDFYRNTNIYKYFKNTFGLLFYPIDVTFDFFNRLSLIKDEEPSITIPTVYEPFTGGVLIEGFVFNLDSILQNDILRNVYDIYLIFVDFIIYGLFFTYLYKIFRSFFNLGGGL